MTDAGDIADSAKAGLKGKIGPVPVWMIATILGIAAVGGYYVYSRKANATASSDATVAASAGTVADGSIAGTGGTDQSYSTTGSSGNVDNTDSGTGYTVPQSAATGAPDSNGAWLISAATAVADSGQAGYIDAFAALVKYVNGDTITSAQKALVDKAIQMKGYPPEGINGLSTVSDPATSTTTAPPAGGTATTTPAPSQSTGTPVTVTNPVKTPPKPAPKPPADPGQTKGNSSVIGTKFTLEKAHKGYLTADAANSQKGAVTTLQPGSYYVFNKATRSGGAMVNLTKVKGIPGTWINP